jgi:hypothetical protein
MLVVEIIPFKTQKERIKLTRECEHKGGFSVHDNFICLYRKENTKDFERLGYDV